jgi:hypothetical protein
MGFLGAKQCEIWTQKVNFSEKQLFQKLEKSNLRHNVVHYITYIKDFKKYRRDEN